MKIADNKPLWTKIGKIKKICLMAKNILLFGQGCFIQFINLHSGEEHFLMMNSHSVNGDGVKSFRGHSTLNLFAYAENCQGPTLYVKSYPDFQLIAKFVGGPKEGYKCLAFSETSLLFSLGEMPHYTVTAWNWRSMEKFSECDNELLFEDQIIRCSYGRPMYLAHMGVKSNKLFIWDVFTVCKTSIFSKHEVKMGKLEPAPFEDIVWSQDSSSLFIIDSKGSIYTVDRDFHLELVINFSTQGDITPSICWYSSGIACTGPNQEVRHYKRNGNEWTSDWSYQSEKKLRGIIGRSEQCLAITEGSEIVSLGDGNCLFGVDSYCLYNNEQHNREIRLQVVEHIINNWKYYKDFIIGDFSYRLSVNNLTDYENFIFLDGEYCGHVELNNNEYAEYRTENIVRPSAESQRYVTKNNSDFKDICLINPAGEFLVARCHDSDLVVYDILTGELVSTFKFENYICSMAENPELPFVAFGFDNGEINLVSFYNEAKPSILVKMALTYTPLLTTRFFEHGQILVTGNHNYGEFFILKGMPGMQMEVAVHLELKLQLTDYMLVASQNMYRFFVLPVTAVKFYAGNEVIRYCIIDNQVVNIKKYDFEKDVCRTLYKKILPKRGPDRDKHFYLIPFNTKHFEYAEIKRGSSLVNIKDNIKTGHQINRFYVSQTQYHTITWGFDGFIFVRSLDLQKQVGMSLSHHRYQQGVHTGRVNPLGTIIVSLGNDGVLAAVHLTKNVEDENVKQRISDLKASTKVALMFKRPTLGFNVEDRFTGKCWKEIQHLKTIEEQEEACRLERNKILKEFRDIQSILQGLVFENFEVPDNKKLDLLEFYLDVPLYNKKQQQNKEECKSLETYLKCLILAQDSVSNYIIKNYWEPMGVQWQNILGIFSVVKATNYCLLPENVPKLKRIKWLEEQRKVEQFLICQDTFEPWAWVSKEKLLENLAKRPTLPKDDYSNVAALRRLREIEEAESNKSLETKIALAGSVAQILIELNTGHYQQRQITSFYQCELQQALVEGEVIKLKQNYNKCFLNTRALKEREMYNVKERNARLRHIVSEYNYFSDKKIYIDIVDPQWAETENPETILRVTDDEIAVMPYVSPSEQAILDAKAAEEERIRLLLLADDFRERALMAMMNGVLEIRWEDELKRDVPKPKCMLEKPPEEFNEDDLRAILEYEEKVEQLITEREKYKSLLDVEFNKVSTIQRESIRRFNQKLYDCTKYKFYIDQSMNQENLQVNRHRLNQLRRIEVAETEKEILEETKIYEKHLEYNVKQVNFMQEALVECRVNLDAMQAKEKSLDKAYRKEFMDMSPVVQEQAYKLYKKRPKATFRNITTATVLIELAKGVITNETSIAMTQECLDYMKGLEHLDLYSGMPPTIDESTWALICKHRRLRIEFDIRLRASQIQILDGEATIATFQKRVATKKEKIAMLNAAMEELRDRRLHLMHNKQIQIVLRRGLVEIPLTGDLYTDFHDAILVPKSEIEHVNKLIVEAGQLKLKTILQNLRFRRKMMAAEWEHMKLRMQINDLIEQKKDIDNVKFTKEMQVYLKNKSLGRKPETESFEMEIELLAAAYENRIKDRKDKYKKTKKQLESYKASNKLLDKAIQEVNVDVCHYKLQKDWDVEVREKEILEARMRAMLKRNQLVQKIQENHNEILVLQTELELLRLRTFPTFKYKVLDE